MQSRFAIAAAKALRTQCPRPRPFVRPSASELQHLLQPLEPRTLLAYTAVGPETVVDEGDGNGSPSYDVAMNDAGDYVIAYYRGSTIHVRPYDADGTPLGEGAELSLPVTRGQYFNASLAMDDDGNFIVVSNADDDLYAQRYDAAANPVGGLFRVNVVRNHPPDEFYHDVEMTGDGAFIIAWSASGHDQIGNHIFARRYDAAGTALGEPFTLSALS